MYNIRSLASLKVIKYMPDYTKFLCSYDKNTNFIFSRCNKTNNIFTTFLYLENCSSVRDVYYLDSYLSTFNRSFNIVHLDKPSLANIYMYFSVKNLYRKENSFYIYGTHDPFVNKFLNINNIADTSIWTFRDSCSFKINL